MSAAFRITARDPGSAARTGVLETPHGAVETPAFMPVASQGTVKALTHDQVESLGAGIILLNSYHLFCILVATKMRKCDFCYDRLAIDSNPSKKPACQLACPPGAISFGNADPIMAEASNRLSYLRTHGLSQAKIYPEDSGSSTHVIWILPQGEGVYGS